MNNKIRTQVKQSVLDILSKCPVLKFPLNIKHIIKSFPNIRLIPYSKQMKNHVLTYNEMLLQAETIDAFTVYSANKDLYLIFYNDIDPGIIKRYRYRWNIAHELGHVALNHHKNYKKTKIYRNSLSSTEYKNLENEADLFAAYILVPHSVLHYYAPQNHFDLRNYCLISDAAAKVRFKEYQIWNLKNKWESYDLQIRSFFYNNAFTKVCSTCGFNFNALDNPGIEIYCPICGKKTLFWGDGNLIYEEIVKLNDNSKAIRCPMCDNENILDDGEYCHICGTYLINKCDNRHWNEGSYYDGDEPCGHLLPANARYCHICGNASTFLNDNILHAWDSKEKHFQEMIIPDSIDEKLPFD